MNDRFKFRVWEKDQKIMKECTQITIDKDQSGSMCDVKGKVTAHLVYQPHYTLMQCTGLKDKNGKLIYEGDIVRFKDCNDILVINYQKEMACFAPQFYCNGKYGGRLCFDDYDSFECQFYKSNNFEVIGNIYENKELLEDTECQK